MEYVLVVLLGLALGSFVNALVWRLHQQEELRAKSLDYSKKHKKQPSRLNSKIQELSIVRGRSMCVHCKHTLAWNDLIPIVSWVMLRGKCRYCHKPIDDNPLVEVTLGILLPLSLAFWPYEFTSWRSYAVFVIWTMVLVVLTALAVYDLRWMILPTRLVFTALGLAAVFNSLLAWQQQDVSILISSAVGSLLLGGLFWLIYQLSKGRWIGGGDVRFGFAMGLLLGWQKSLLGLTAAAYIGLVVIIAIACVGKYHRKMRLPFGPMLIAGTYISLLWGQQLIDIYKGLSGL